MITCGMEMMKVAKATMREISKTEYLLFQEINAREWFNLDFCTVNLFCIPEICNQNFHLSKTVELHTISIVFYSD